MPIKMKSGKDYYTVVERMDMLLEEQGKDNYSLTTEVTYESGVVIVKATLILYPNARVYCGHALGELGKAKSLEATETHAIGRALSSAGWFGSEFASANEMEAYEVSKPVKKKSIKKSGGMSEQDRLVTDPDYSDKDEIAFTDVPAEPTIKNIINFGKHNGKDWSEVDASYVDWVANKSNVDWQREEAKKELKRRS